MLEIGEKIGWNHGEAQVFHARWQGRPAVLKRHRKQLNYTREVYGYHVWNRSLPELLHAQREQLELVLSHMPGECALGLPQTEELYRAAGVALRQMHDTAPLSLPFEDGRADLRGQVNRYISACGGSAGGRADRQYRGHNPRTAGRSVSVSGAAARRLHRPQLALGRRSAHSHRSGTRPARPSGAGHCEAEQRGAQPPASITGRFSGRLRTRLERRRSAFSARHPAL